tara:strand:- start:883 stop:1317 length:435 start_codon:yes stop_codon:yes gene_type:complete
MGCYYSFLYKNYNFDNTPTWSLKGKKIKVKVLKVYDGDTIWIALKLKGKIYKLKIRLYGIDTPEMKPPKNQVDRDKEIAEAKKSKTFLSDLVLNKIITIKCGDWDKYGRLLATLYINNYCSNIDVNKLMIEKGLAKEYFGGTKN